MRSVTEPAPQNSITNCQMEQKCHYCNDADSILQAAQSQGRTLTLLTPLWGHRSATQSHQDIILNLSACNACGFCYRNETIKGRKVWKARCSPEGWEQGTGISAVLENQQRKLETLKSQTAPLHTLLYTYDQSSASTTIQAQLYLLHVSSSTLKKRRQQDRCLKASYNLKNQV